MSGLLAFGLLASLVPAVNAGDTIVYAEENTIYTDEATINSGSSTIYVEGDYNEYPGFRPSVTILHSANNEISNSYYNPKLTEIPDLKQHISKEGEFAIVYDGYWDLNHKEPNKGNDPNRVYEILGYDAQLLREKYEFSNRSSEMGTYLASPANTVTKEFAIMSIYKALNKDIIRIYTKSYEDNSLRVNNSPIAEIITVPITDVDISRGLTKVFISRSQPELYWQRAKDDRLILDDYSQQEPLSVGEFCLLVKQAMHQYGEPILTQEEENYLLEVYGRLLPYSLPAVQLDAVKYLMARGIVLPEYNYHDDISVDTALEILMRVKDKESRETFKNLELTYDKDIIEKGYYPTEVSFAETGIEYISSNFDYATATHFDYFVRRNENTIFVNPDSGTEAQIVYVSATPGDTSEQPMPGSQYLGVEGDYYHFRVPANISANSAYQSKGYITINSAKLEDMPENYQLEIGGGYYEAIESDHMYKRKAFVAADSHLYVDTDRKQGKQELQVGRTGLYDIAGGKYEVVMKIPDDMKRNIIYDGKTFDEAVTAGTIERANGQQNWYKFKGLVSSDDIKDKLKITSTMDSNGNRIQTYQAFGRLGKDLLVNVNYLKATGKIKGIDWITDDILLLYSDTQNVYIDQFNNRIINGTTVTDVAKGTPLVYKAKGDTFVDYRAVLGWTSDVFLFTDDNGVVTITSSTSNSSKLKRYQQLYSPYGMGLANVSMYENKVLLTSSYALAPYFVYQCRDDSKEVGDWIFSIKLKTDQKKIDDKAARDAFTKKFGITPNEEEYLVYMAPLYSDAKSTQNPTGISWTQYGYVYEPATIPQNIQNAHYNLPTGNDKPAGSLFIPIYKDGTMYYDMNLNIARIKDLASSSTIKSKDISYGKIPGLYLHSAEDSKLKYYEAKTRAPSNTGTTEWDSLAPALKSQLMLRPAPVGVISFLIDTTNPTWESAGKNTSFLYYGTIPAVTYNTRRTTYLMPKIYANAPTNAREFFGPTKEETSEEETIFKTVFRRDSGLTIAYIGNSFQLATAPPEKEPAEVKTGNAAGQFDWKDFSFKKFVTNLDDWLTIAVIFVLNLLPRFFTFLFMVLLTLSCIARVRVWRNFCTSIWDPYKFLTLGRQTVDTVNLKFLFVTSIIGIACFGFFQNGLIMELIAWLIRAVTGILSR